MRQPPSPPEQERLRGASICQVMRDNGCSTIEQLRDKIFDELRAANAPRHIQIAQTAEPAQPTNVAQPIAAQPIAAQPARPSESAQVTEPVQGAHPKRKIFILSTKLSTSSEYIIAVYTTAQHANFTALRYAAKAFSIYRTEIMDFIPGFPAPGKQHVVRTSWANDITEIKREEEFVEVYPKWIEGVEGEVDVIIEGERFRVDEDPVEDVELLVDTS